MKHCKGKSCKTDFDKKCKKGACCGDKKQDKGHCAPKKDTCCGPKGKSCKCG